MKKDKQIIQNYWIKVHVHARKETVLTHEGAVNETAATDNAETNCIYIGE